LNVDINGLNINYNLKGDGELIVLLHGWGSNINLFENLIQLLSKKYRVVAMDMPGFGESDEPNEAWCVDDYVDFVIDFLKPYKAEKISFLGHSFGGRVIAKMQINRNLPFIIDKVILVDSAGVKSRKSFQQKVKLRAFKVTKKILSVKIIKSTFPEALDYWRGKFGSSDYNTSTPIMRQILVNVINEDLTQYFELNVAETLLIWGKNDNETPVSDGRLMEERMPNAGLVILDNCGHYSFLEQQYVFNKVISSFMNI